MLIDLTLDIEKGTNRFSTLDNPITLRQQDAEAYVFNVNLRQGGAVLDLTGMTVRFYALRPDGGKVIDGENVAVLSAPDGIVQYTVPAKLTQAAGDIPTSYIRISSGDWSASTGNIAIRVVPSVAIEATGGDYIPEIDHLINALEAQRVTYDNAEDARASECRRSWTSLQRRAAGRTAPPTAARPRSASLKVDYDDLTDDAKEKIAAMASAGVVFATHAEIDEAFESIIAPAIGTDTVLDGLTQEDYDYAFGKVFGQ